MFRHTVLASCINVTVTLCRMQKPSPKSFQPLGKPLSYRTVMRCICVAGVEGPITVSIIACRYREENVDALVRFLPHVFCEQDHATVLNKNMPHS